MKNIKKKDYDLIKQALKRNEPMELVVDHPAMKPTCNNCYFHVPKPTDSYCANCGQKIDWSGVFDDYPNDHFWQNEDGVFHGQIDYFYDKYYFAHSVYELADEDPIEILEKTEVLEIDGKKYYVYRGI